MAESRRGYVWTIQWEDPLSAVAAQPAAAEVVARMARRYRWIQSGTVRADGGELRIELVVRANDQWRVHERQLRVAGAVAAAIRVGRDRMGEPCIRRLPHHRQIHFRCATEPMSRSSKPPPE